MTWRGSGISCSRNRPIAAKVSRRLATSYDSTRRSRKQKLGCGKRCEGRDDFNYWCILNVCWCFCKYVFFFFDLFLFGVGHWVFNLHALRSCASSMFTCFLHVFSYLITPHPFCSSCLSVSTYFHLLCSHYSFSSVFLLTISVSILLFSR